MIKQLLIVGIFVIISVNIYSKIKIDYKNIENYFWEPFSYLDSLVIDHGGRTAASAILLQSVLYFIGQPGGGPFWIEMQGAIRKQIVEKAQISGQSDQIALLQESSHFNPVMMVLSPLDLNGNKLDLEQFVDYQQYFVVSKMHHGQPIRYVERPGLWNGSMANWTTVFVEIPSEVFSPVKEITDLLNEAHQPL